MRWTEHSAYVCINQDNPLIFAEKRLGRGTVKEIEV